MSPPTIAYIGLGSNQQYPVEQLQRALTALAALPHSRLLRRSSLYRSTPLGPAGQPDYINAVAALKTSLDPHQLLAQLQQIEQAQGRVRTGERWGPRTLDLDLLLYGEQQINEPQLTVPHPGLPARNFVLYPLQEIAPQLVIPGHGALSRLIKNLPMEGLECLET